MRIRKPSGVAEESIRIQRAVAKELEGRAMEAIRARLHGDIDNRSLRITELGGRVSSNQLKLFNRVNARIVCDQIVFGFIDIKAI